jgi:hypothetical protein
MYPSFFAKNCGLGCFVLGLVVCANAVRGDVLVSNLAEPVRASSPMGNNPNPVEPPDNSVYWYWAAQSFTTDANPYALISIEGTLGEGSVDPAPVVIAELYADDGGAMGQLIATLTAPDLSGPLATRTFIPAIPITLEPNTTYWFLLGSQTPGDGTFLWTYANSNNFTGSGAIGNYADSNDSGATWTYRTDFPYFLQVNVQFRSDTDGDGVDDIDDVCCNTPDGTAVDVLGRPTGDLDLDCDTDLDDYQLFQRGFTGPLTDPTECP